MSEQMVITHCSPTLAGIKTGNLFACRYESKVKMMRQIRDLNHALAAELLDAHGYESGQTGRCIVRLMHRLGEYEEFPHEIGLFLGYPPEDVQGFIHHKGSDCKCVGCWKVYGDEDKAKKCFADYKKCTRIYSEQYAKGRSIERLTVAV